MTIWAIADLHLAFGVPEKTMEVFGPEWKDYGKRIQENWEAVVAPDDLVLIAGDISWAMHLKEAKIDLDWIDALPGIKVMIKGNHDYWWSSLSKAKSILPSSIHLIQNSVFNWGEYSIGGTRLWDHETAEDQKIFNREVQRLELSLSQLDKKASKRLVMTHYPPTESELVTALLEKYNVDVCVFGHLHGLKYDPNAYGEKNGVRYILTAADYIRFKPVKVF